MDFNNIGSTPMDDPAMVFGNPWPSSRRLEKGDIIIAEDNELDLEAGTVAMPEPTIITPDGLLGIFFGRTYVLTEGGKEQVTKFPHELIVI